MAPHARDNPDDSEDRRDRHDRHDRDGQAQARWQAALRAAVVFCVDPQGLGGIVLRSAAGPVRQRWLQAFGERLPAQTPVIRVPAQVGDERLLGGLDLAATLAAGKPVAATGLLQAADGGILLLACAERLPARMAAHVAAALDCGEIALERDAMARRIAARVAVIALDEGADDDEAIAPALAERLAIRIELDDVRPGLPGLMQPEQASVLQTHGQAIERARHALAQVQVTDEVLQALCETAASMGIDSMRAPLLAVRVARVLAALDGRLLTNEDDAFGAAQLALGWRARRLPASDPSESGDPDEPHEQPPAERPPPSAQDESPPPATDEVDARHKPDDAPADSNPSTQAPGTLPERILQATMAALPAGLLTRLVAQGAAAAAARTPGRAGAPATNGRHGRRTGSRRGTPGGHARLDLVETLRAAAPWQPIRRRSTKRRLIVLRDDLRIQRFEQRRTTTTVFVVDASGSSALHRLAEAKGAVELLLAECYVRRDRVALIAFRGQAAEVVLPPTRALARARRSLSGLPGGGGTPLAAALVETARLTEELRRQGDIPVMVLLSDCRANVCLDGSGGRARAGAEALQAAQALRSARLESVVIDTSPLAQPIGRELAQAMGARYLALPHADAARLATALTQAKGH
jgi:magnesium chelatase subunit D